MFTTAGLTCRTTCVTAREYASNNPLSSTGEGAIGVAWSVTAAPSVPIVFAKMRFMGLLPFHSFPWMPDLRHSVSKGEVRVRTCYTYQSETMNAKPHNCAARCPAVHALGVIGGSWKVPIVWHLAKGPRRFSDLRRDLGDVTAKVLTQQLRELEADGVVSRKVYAQVPPKVEYALTARGRSLMPVVQAMCEWGSARTRRG
jgi:DNA-binding HxlR family transcriptional regulator